MINKAYIIAGGVKADGSLVIIKEEYAKCLWDSRLEVFLFKDLNRSMTKEITSSMVR